MLDNSICFHEAPFPDGFSPCGSFAASGAAPLHGFMFHTPRAAIAAGPLVYQFPPPATPTTIEAAPVPYQIEAPPFQHTTSLPPTDGERGSTFFPPDPSSNRQSWYANFDYDFPTVTGSEGYTDNSILDDHQMVSDMSVRHPDRPPSLQQLYSMNGSPGKVWMHRSIPTFEQPSLMR
jgi:hypothetical protein